jgi:hypothetical protein
VIDTVPVPPVAVKDEDEFVTTAVHRSVAGAVTRVVALSEPPQA